MSVAGTVNTKMKKIYVLLNFQKGLVEIKLVDIVDATHLKYIPKQ